MVQTLQKTVEVPQLQFVVFFFSEGPVRRHLCRGAETDSHGPVQDQRNSSVAVH